MKTFIAGIILLVCGTAFANAQTDMSCADLLKTNKQMEEATKGMAKDAESAAMDKKVNDYCAKNPAAKASEAMEKALSE